MIEYDDIPASERLLASKCLAGKIDGVIRRLEAERDGGFISQGFAKRHIAYQNKMRTHHQRMIERAEAELANEHEISRDIP